MRTRTLTAIGTICLGLALVACSDDDEKNPQFDGGQQDTAVKDTGKTDDIYDPDVVSPDQMVPVPDQAVPDADPGIPSKWKEVQKVSDALLEVWPIDSKNVIAVGKGGLIMKYDGSTWTTMTNPDTNKSGLRAIYAGGSYLFAMGDGVDLYYDGTKWNMGYSYATSYAILDIWGAKSGTYMFNVDQGSSYPYIRYRSKTSTTTSWSSIYLSSSVKTLNGIWGVSDAEVYVVGEAGTIMVCSGVTTCAAYSSSNWKAMTSGTTSNLQAIWGSSNKDIFAVGLDGVILHYDGTKWSTMTSGTSTYFYDVWGSGPNDVYAVGHPIFKNDESIFHYDGTSWSKMPPPHTTFLEAVRGTSASDVWVVGKTHILHYDGK